MAGHPWKVECSGRIIPPRRLHVYGQQQQGGGGQKRLSPAACSPLPFFFQLSPCCPLTSTSHPFISFHLAVHCFAQLHHPFAPTRRRSHLSKLGQSTFKVLAQKLFPHESLLPGQQKAPTLRGPMAKRGNERRPIYWRRRRKQCPRLALITFFPPLGAVWESMARPGPTVWLAIQKPLNLSGSEKAEAAHVDFGKEDTQISNFPSSRIFFGNSPLFQLIPQFGFYCFVRGNGRLWQWQKIK